MRILYCTTVLPSGRRTGGEIATQSFIDALRAAGHRVTVLGYRRPGDTPPTGEDEIAVGARAIETGQAGSRAYAWLLAALLKRRPYSAEKYVSPAYRGALRDGIGRFAPGVVILDHAQIGFLLDELPHTLPLVFVAHNVESGLYRAQRDAAANPLRRRLMAREAALIGRIETRLVRAATQTWVLTEHDRQHFLTAAHDRRVLACAVPTSTLVERGAHGAPPKWDLGLIGTWTWEANAAGLRWFQHEVVPKLPQRWRVAVAGKGAAGVLAPPAQALGFVPDAQDFLRSCSVICIPATAGGGVQVKTLDAIAAGRPVVATSVAMRGIESPPPSVRIADTPEAFAAAIGEAHAASGTRTCDEALDWSRSRHEAFRRRIAACIEQLDPYRKGTANER